MFQVKLSQEHPTLPVAELRAVVETCYPEENVVLEFNENVVKIQGIGYYPGRF